ncbi:unnamed protein product [Prorocentrum cordatum]|uniref:Uncharacterized protein n=1 Tax=Prorocentrum cordatum TaxID=2364126 RepID=A0ABN9Y4R4_9DINO|nr:unnamed protein product [Polarella glacialis]
MIENDDNNKISSEPEASGDGRGGISTEDGGDEQEADEEGDAEDDDCGGGGVTTKAFPSGCRACTCAGELLPRRGTTTVTQDQRPARKLCLATVWLGGRRERERGSRMERRYRVVVVLFVLPGSGI